MSIFLHVLLPLVCVACMGPMMWGMMRSRRKGASSADQVPEVRRVRSEADEQRDSTETGAGAAV